MTTATLVTGGTAASREAAIHSLLDSSATAVILEGLPDGHPLLDISAFPSLQLSRIAPGCLCCTGNLVMRVTLNRLLRTHPARLYIGVASDEHLPALRTFLQGAPYDRLLTLTDDVELT